LDVRSRTISHGKSPGIGSLTCLQLRHLNRYRAHRLCIQHRAAVISLRESEIRCVTRREGTVRTTFPIATGTLPLLVIVTVCGIPTRVKVNDEGDKVTGPPDSARPTHVNGIDSGELTPLLVISSEALRAPAAEGMNAICTLHGTPGGTYAQLLARVASEKSAEFSPTIEIPVSAIAFVAVLFTDTNIGAEGKDRYAAWNAPGADHGVYTDANGYGIVTEDRLYRLVRQQSAIQNRTFRFEFLAPGVQAYSFTFG
jgi:hypothetical protein